MTDLQTTAGVLEWALTNDCDNNLEDALKGKGSWCCPPPEGVAAFTATAARIAANERLRQVLGAGACLTCGAEPGCNIDCALCVAYAAAIKGRTEEKPPNIEAIVAELGRQYEADAIQLVPVMKAARLIADARAERDMYKARVSELEAGIEKLYVERNEALGALKRVAELEVQQGDDRELTLPGGV